MKEVTINSNVCGYLEDVNGDTIIEVLEFEMMQHNIGGVNYWGIKLENGVILHDDREFQEWNGECYSVDQKDYFPVTRKIDEDDFEIIGYYER